MAEAYRPGSPVLKRETMMTTSAIASTAPAPLDSVAFASAVDAFWRAWQGGVYFPPAWHDRLCAGDGYRISLALAARRQAAGDRQVGWKVGLTAKSIQEQFGVHEPVFGCLFEEGRKPSGHVFGARELIRPGFENEVCVVLGRDLPPAGAGGAPLDLATIRQAVDHCRSAVEVTETRGDFLRHFPLALADNVQQKAFVVGAPVPLGDDLDLPVLTARVRINGAEVATGRGDAVLDHPLNSIAWLARRLADFGLQLKAGDHIMTGSFTRQFPLAPGDRIVTEFDRLGSVELSVAPERGT
jgi:2-keto-4-pentenoate hydratase